jgi:hypothetical protein
VTGPITLPVSETRPVWPGSFAGPSAGVALPAIDV